MRLHRTTDPAAAGLDRSDTVDDLLDALHWPTWWLDALCTEPAFDALSFFDGPAAPDQAVRGGCLVQEECLDYALEHEIVEGVWGGTTERERRTMLRSRRAA